VGWLTLDVTSGTGNGTVNATASANLGPSRNGTATVATQTYTATETGGCAFSIAPSSHNYPAAGASQLVTLTASDNSCAWTASYSDSWLTGPTSGTGSASLTVTATANSGPPRTSTPTIAGLTFTGTQGVFSCTFSIAPSAHNYSAAGGSQAIAVTASDSSCAWTASAAGWLTLDITSGTGSATIHATASANSGTARNVTLTIAGQSFSATQDDGRPQTGISLSPRVPATPGVRILTR
jgi:hypothetical protein